MLRALAGITLTLGALSLLAIHWAYPSVVFDGAAIVLIVLAAAPFLTVFVDRLRFGDLEIVARRADKALVEATKLRREHAAERTVILERDRVQDLWLGKVVAGVAGSGAAGHGTGGPVSPEMLLDLARDYDEISAAGGLSESRSAEVNDIVIRMLGYAQQVESFDLDAALASRKAGNRLAGYIWLFARPNHAYIHRLFDAIGDEDSVGVLQYWAIRALRTAVVASNCEISQANVQRISAVLDRLPIGSDRRRELEDLLHRVDDDKSRPSRNPE